ncbi:FecR domain-containing protein [Halobacteriovorax sp.]|uniref:FecR family protein n=1 Tax=Halobacteriovorax sp. TaxID=2020862 RepID=UPI00356B1A21
MIKSYIFVVLIFLSHSSFAKTHIATVSKLRGKASVLSPGDVNAHILKVNDKLSEDASIVTYKGSFVRVKFNDGSTASLGPNSKLIVTKMNTSGAGIITLLKGQLRSKVSPEKTKKGKHKFLVRTKSAALGVRGTEFQTIYNPENNVTNLLTYEGEVAIKKGEHKILSGKSYSERAKALSSDKLSRSQKIRLKNKLVDIVENSLETDNTVVVKAGQFSSSVGGVEDATLPVNISPVQLNTLYKNEDLVQNVKTSQSSVVTSSDSSKGLKVVPQTAPKEGIYDKNNSKFAQKSGGFIDITTGLYIPPTPESEFSQKENVYLAKNVGGIDPVTGQYVAPEGLVLDAKRGFLVQNNVSPEKLKLNIAQAKKMNEVIEKDVVIRDSKVIAPVKYYSQLEIFSKNSIAIKLTSVSNTIDHSNSSTANRVIEDTGKGFSVMWNHSSGGKWQPISNFHYKSIRFQGEELGVFSQGSSSLFGMDVGMKRYLTERLNFSTMIKLRQNYYTVGTSDPTYRLQKSTFTNIELGGQYFIIKSKRFDVDLSAAFAFAPSKTARDVDVDSSTVLTLGGGFRYWLSRGTWMRFGVESQNTSYEVSSTNYNATDDNSMFEVGIEVGFVL